jgi:hypothetical protein
MKYDYLSFGRPETGRVVTEDNNSVVMYSTNPYGGENLVLVDLDTDVAFRHGNDAVLAFARQNMARKAYRRAVRFLVEHGVPVNEWRFIASPFPG